MDTVRLRSVLALCVLVTGLAGCQWPGGSTSAPPSRVPAGVGPETPLAVALAMLQTQLDSVLADGLDNAGPERLNRAEAISDRLLETRLPFAWLSAKSYSLEARLRQIQTMADRVGALQAGGARSDEVLAEVDSLRVAVARLREDLEGGGTAAPTPVEELLRTLDTSR